LGLGLAAILVPAAAPPIALAMASLDKATIFL